VQEGRIGETLDERGNLALAPVGMGGMPAATAVLPNSRFLFKAAGKSEWSSWLANEAEVVAAMSPPSTARDGDQREPTLALGEGRGAGKRGRDGHAGVLLCDRQTHTAI
jgi:hypothetical protein